MGNGLIDLVVAIVALCGAIVAVGMLGRGSLGSLYDRIGEANGSSASGQPPEPRPGSAAAIAERDLEVRQLLQARSERRMRRGQAPLDVEAEVSRLLVGPGGTRGADDSGNIEEAQTRRRDPELVEELRQLAEARNQRRLRRGEAPLDVRAEVERALAELDV
jgi:hypothetical protein